MTISELPLSYCTNVHAGLTVAEVERGLTQFTQPLQQSFGQPLAAGLWLAEPVVRELRTGNDALDAFAHRLSQRNLTCHTLNAFPYGDFHSERVKENVYLPDWADPRRLQYTQACAEILSRLLPDSVSGSISTVPLGFKQFQHADTFQDTCAKNLIELARKLADIEAASGKTIRLAIEPEPLCLLETTEETLAFFNFLFDRADAAGELDMVRRHIGVCYDVCHQAVEFEDVAASIRSLDAAGIGLNKIHITCAIELADPAHAAEGRNALAEYVEPRYLHQTLARTRSGEILKAVDLTRELALHPPAEYAEADTWRIHYHVPVGTRELGPLRTTFPDLVRALEAVAGLESAPHLEVETYTWNVLQAGKDFDLVSGLCNELQATADVLEQCRR